MTNITAAQVKELREATGVGMMECKKALQETNGDMDKAVLWLRERGLARAAKKAGRTAAEGFVKFAIGESRKEAVLVEVNCETDFSAKSADFRSFVEGATALALKHKVKSVEELGDLNWDGTPISQRLAELIAKVGENMNLRRVKRLEATDGFLVGYNHMDGRIGTLVAFSGSWSEKAQQVGADLAMHVAASAPRFFSREEVSAAELDQEKDIARKKLKEQGKSDEVIEKALTGNVNKFYGEVCFIDQPFVKEPKVTVAQYVKQSGTGVEAKEFVRFQLGEGIEVKEQNFAEEVAATLKNR